MSRTAKAFFWSYVFLLFLRKVSTAHPDMICRKYPTLALSDSLLYCLFIKSYNYRYML